MILNYIHSDNSKEKIELDLEVPIKDDWINISSKNKLEFIKTFLPAFMSGQKTVLFDSNHKQLVKFHEENKLSEFDDFETVDSTAQLLFFTSGSSGFPVGAFKTRENILQEVKELVDLVQNYKIKKVVVTVPFVHIYGVLVGLLLPLSLGDIELVIKEDFLPYEVLSESRDGDTLIVTTPVFIKALGKLSEDVNMSSNLFICSTGPLQNDDISVFQNKYNTNLLQLFGSTETGGIAYKLSTNEFWKPLPSSKVKSNDDKLQVESPFISPYILDKKIKRLEQPFVTEDIIELNNDGFKLIGRSNKLIKIAGKRISAAHIESILESIEGVEKAVVELVYKKELLRSEQILIKLQAKTKIGKSLIKSKIAECFGVLTIPFKVEYVEEIGLSAMGKKVIF